MDMPMCEMYSAIPKNCAEEVNIWHQIDGSGRDYLVHNGEDFDMDCLGSPIATTTRTTTATKPTEPVVTTTTKETNQPNCDVQPYM